MSTDELLALLAEREVMLTLDGDELVIRAEKEVLDGELVSLVRENKQTLIDRLHEKGYVDSRSGAVFPARNGIMPGSSAITPAMVPLVQLSEDELERIVATVPGGAHNVQDIYPLAPLQEGIFFHHLLTGEGDPYLLRSVQRFDSRARLDRFIAALQAVIDRHDILRTAVVWEGLREPVQVVWRQARVTVETVTSDRAAGDPIEQLTARFDPRHYRLDVRQAPLFHVAVAREEPSGRWVMVLVFHHLVSDHVALQMIFDEIKAHLRGEGQYLPAPLPFRNFVAQARFGVSRESHEAFFREMLGDVEEPTAPLGLIDVHRDGTRTGEAVRVLDRSLSQRLRAHSRALGVSTASMCHVAWARVLGALSGRDDVVFGTVLFGRMQGSDAARRALGLLINTLPLRVHLAEAGVKECLRRMHDALAALMRHEHASLALAQRCSSVAAPTPLFSAIINYRHIRSEDTVAEASAPWEGIEFLRADERTNYPLSLSVDDFGERLGLTAEAATPVDPVRICDYMQTALESLAEALDREPNLPTRKLNVLPGIERRRLLVDWNATEARSPVDARIHRLFEAQVARTPDAVAVVYDGAQLTYRELDARADRLARHLRRIGVVPETRVALCVQRSIELVVAVLATLKAGGAYVPIDPAYPVDRLRLILSDCTPLAVLTYGSLPAPVRHMLAAENAAVIDLGPASQRWEHVTSEDVGSRDGTSHDAAYVIYTSGSTGLPKGVVVEHRSVVNLMAWMQDSYRFGSMDAVLHKTPLSFDVSVWEMFAPLLSGARLVIARPDGHKDPEYLAQVIQEQQITAIDFVPSMLQLFLEEATAARCTSLRHVLCGGEVLPGELARRFGEVLPGARLHNEYGPTEATVTATSWESNEATATSDVSIGRPVWNTRTYILDGYGEPVPIGVSGELHIGGAQVARGYLNRPELTAARFIPNPFVPGDRLYKTGDLARFSSDGTIDYLGRSDFQVKIRGFRIELGEVEARLRDHELIHDAAVVVREDVPGEKRLVAYYSPRDAMDVSVDELRSTLSAALPEYMVPATYVRVDSLPRMPHGKLDRTALPVPDSSAYVERRYEAPRDEVEQIIARVWSDVLEVDRVGRNDNFFELGGHSLLAVRVLSRIRQELRSELKLSQLFGAPVLRDLARLARRAGVSTLPAMTHIDRDGPLPLSFAQQRLWFLSQMEGVSAAYHVPLALRMHGTLDARSLRRALDALVSRHETLRTTFELLDGNPVQRIGSPECGFWLLEHDIRVYDDRAGELARLQVVEATAAFDLESGPLIRGRLITVDTDEHVLLLTMHHIVADGWSVGILLSELGVLYRGYRADVPVELPPLEIQYADYAAWQREHLNGAVLQEQLEYWKRALAGIPVVHQLPTDRPRPAQQDLAGDYVRVELDAALTARLRALSHAHGTTLFTSLLTAWGLLLGRLSGDEDVVTGAPVANRRRSEIEGLIGLFLNTLVLRIDLTGNPSVGELLDRVNAQALAAQEHQDVPFERVVEALQPPRSPAHTPLFQVWFAWQHDEHDDVDLPELRVSGVGAPVTLAQFDLTLNLGEVGDRIAGGLLYSTALFDRSTIERWVAHLRALLEAMVADETQNVAALAILSESERLRILVDWNATATAFSDERCIHELFEDQVVKAPHALAVVYEDTQLTYGELNAQANRLARHLRGIGVEPDTRVALCVERSLEMMIGVLAISKSGGAYVPLDPSYPVDRLQYMLEDCAPVAVLTNGAMPELVQDMLRASGAAVVDLQHDAFRWVSEPSGNLSRSGLTPAHLAYVIYTSGSTGLPKGVMVEHRGVCNLATAQARFLSIDAGSRVLQFASCSFDAFVSETTTALCHGASLYVPSHRTILAGAALVRVVETHRISHATLPPVVLSDLPLHAELEPIRVLVAAGDRLAEELVQRWAPGRVLINAYGPTESTVCATMHLCDAKALGNPPIGRPIANTRVYILDKGRAPVPIGVVGEMYIGGAGVARGYLNRPELTASRFMPSPFVAGDRLYATGDLARYLPDGTIDFLGRNDFQVKIRGFRIELGEIEDRLRSHELIRDAAVLAREDTPGEKRLVAYYTSRDAAAAPAGELRSYLLRMLPEYMAPAAYVHLDAFPLTPSGKLDRLALPSSDTVQPARPYDAPVGEIEETVAEVWSEVLDVERVSRGDDFFELGGHSLLAVDMVGRLSRAGLDVDVHSVFESSTLESFAAATRRKSDRIDLVPPNLIPPGANAITPSMVSLIQLTAEEIDRIVATVPGGASNVQDIYPLAPLQEGLLFHQLLAGESDPYVARELLHFGDRAELDRYIAALQVVIDRHDICRTAFVWEGLREPVQVVWRRAPLVVEEIDVRPDARDVVEGLTQGFDRRHHRVDVHRAPLIMFAIARNPVAGTWIALRVSHDLVIDRFTAGLMDREIGAHLHGDRLPEPVPFRNYIARMRSGASLDEHEAFFRDMLGDVEEPIAPFGLIEMSNDGVDMVHGHRGVDADLLVRLRAQARAFGVSVASICHLAWGRVLAVASDRDDAVFGTVLFGRAGDEGTGRAMGLFINTLPVRVRSGPASVNQRVRETHEMLAGLMRHEHASLALAQRCSGVAAPTPLFGAFLNFRHSESLGESLTGRRLSEWLEVLESSEERSSGSYYPLMLEVDDLGTAMMLSVQVRASLNAKRICALMHTALQQLTDAMEFEPSKPMNRIGVLSESERRLILVDWNATETPQQAGRCVHQLFEQRASLAPDAAAVVFEHTRVTYGELNGQANKMARYLRSIGVAPDSRVALCAERGPEMVVGLFAVLKAGGAYVPLDPSYPVDRLRYMLADSAPVAVLVHGAVPDEVQEALRAFGAPVIDLQLDAARWSGEPEHDPDRPDLKREHLAYVIYTSGSTGRPKGVMVEHRNLTNYVAWAMAAYAPDHGSVVSSSISFDATVTSLFVPLSYGSVVELLPAGAEVEALEARMTGKADPVLVKITPAHLDSLGRQLTASAMPLSNVFVVGGEALPASTVDMWRRTRPGVRLVNEYGPTEATVGCVAYELPRGERDSRIVPIGRPIWNTRIYILDDVGEPVPVGASGELYIGGAGVARGYLNSPEMTAERFVPSPFVPGDRLYKTGDLARYLADGNIEYLGRNDSQVKIRGFRVELGEIEARLADHESVRDAVVIAREDVPGEKRLAAYYTSAGAEELSAAELRSHLTRSLPAYMVPTAYVHMRTWPVTPNGKVDRKNLPMAQSTAHHVDRYEAPLSEVEESVARIWSDVLKLERIGRHDNFFELGGHSLLAVRVLSRMRQELEVQLNLTQVFANPTLREVAQAIRGATVGKLPAVKRVDRGGPLDLSFAQQRLWFLSQMEGVSEAYHISMGLGLRGALDVDALRRALDILVWRHEPLRTTFSVVDGKPVQRIGAADSGFCLTVCDLRVHGNGSEQLGKQRLEEATTAFDLESGPLIRGRLIVLGSNEHVLLITMHHVVSDGWSMGILLDELSALYRGYHLGTPVALPELDIQYADYAAWQREHLSGALLQEQLNYWEETLAGVPEVHHLPTDRARPLQQDHTGGFVRVELDAQLTRRLRDLSRAHGTTLFTTLLAAWALLLGRLSGDEDVVIGTPTANRDRTEIEGLIGFFVNTLVLRLDLSGKPSVGALLDRVKSQTLAAQERRDVPFEQVVEAVQPPRSLAHTPLFQVLFAWQNTEGGEVSLPGLEVSGVGAPVAVAQFDLTLTLGEANGRIVGGIIYAAALFDRITVERYVDHLNSLLEAMVTDESQSVTRLPMLSDGERRRILVDWNATETAFPADRCVHELFEDHVAAAPDAVALVREDTRLTYGELNAKANRLARHLRTLGVLPDTLVALCVERSLDMVVGLLAVLKAGGAYLPLDPSYPVERLRFMLEDSAPVAILTQAAVADPVRETLRAAGVAVVDLDRDAERWVDAAAGNLERSGLMPEHLAYAIYTSGSTGLPKGVTIEHRSVCNLSAAQTQALSISSNSRVLQFASISFDAFVWETIMALCHGASLYIPSHGTVLVGDELLETVAKNRITHATLPPLVLNDLPLGTDLEPIRVLVAAGDRLSGESVARWGLGRQLVNAYGPTEATVCATLQRCATTVPGDPPIGRPIANARVYILDREYEPVPVGVTGDLYIGGAGVARGFLNRPELSAERFVPSPFVSGDRLYKTGDLARYLPDGAIQYLGRDDFQVKIRGFRIELGEIESRLRDHELIRDAVVLARDDGPGERRLVAYYTTRGTAEVSVDALRSSLLELLPEYMVPAAYVALEALPLTPSGKLDRQALPAPESDAYGVRGYEAPLGPVEETIARIWSGALEIDRVGRHDNFFRLGGHSLLAVAVLSEMRAAGLHSDIRALFGASTLKDLARDIGAAPGDGEVPPNGIAPGTTTVTPAMLPLVRLSEAEIALIVDTVSGGARNLQDIYPLAPLQEGILFHHLSAKAGDPYLLRTLQRFDSRARLDAFLAALQAVIDRHDILRTAVVWEGLREPVQVVWREAQLVVEEVDFDLTGGDVAVQLYDKVDPRRHRSDVQRAPLLRAVVSHEVATGSWLLALTLHHLVSDHTTLEAILGEIQAHLAGQGDSLTTPPPFRNFVAQAFRDVSREEHESFFRTALGDVEESTTPFGLTDVQGDGSGIVEAQRPLDRALSDRLHAHARALGVSTASIVHLAWARVLGVLSGRDDVVFGTVLFGRMMGSDGSERALGLFINTLPLRVKVGEGRVRESVRRTHDALAQLLRHEHASLALAQRCSSVMAPAPLFSALLNYRHIRPLQTVPEVRRDWEGIEFLDSEERTNYPLMLSVNDFGDSLSLTAQVVASIGPARICDYMQTALESMVQALDRAEDGAVRKLAVLPEGERRQIVVDWNATAAAFPSDHCIHELFEERVANAPDTVAVAYEGEELSYRELNARANTLARHLRSLGVEPDTRVALCLERSLDMAVALLAVLKSGAAYVPLDPSYPADRLRYMLGDSVPLAVLTHGAVAGSVREILRSSGFPVIDLERDSARWAREPASDLGRSQLTPEHLASVFYTSGTTGSPKGVMSTHRGACNLLSWLQKSYELRPSDIVLQKTSFGFADAFWELLWPLLSGAKVSMARSEGQRDPQYLAQVIQDQEITVLLLVPSMLQVFLEQDVVTRCRTLRLVLSSGEALPASLVERCRERLPAAELHNLYGQSEAAAVVTAWPCTTGDASEVVPIGRPIANTRAYILDVYGEPVPPGVAGELYIGGVQVARGYLDRPELTAERFIPSRFVSGDRLYKTGDLARYTPDGNIEYLGRNDFQVKIRGFRIELGEIEARLREHERIRESILLAREDIPGEKRLVAYYTTHDGEKMSAEDLRSHLSRQLPEYMLPAAYVGMAALPLTPSGKVDRKSFPAPGSDAYAKRQYEAPLGKVEQTIAEIWSDVLKVESIGRNDNFFELGGYSLLMMTVAGLLKMAGFTVTIGDLFAHQTVKELANLLGAHHEDVRGIVTVRAGGTQPPLFLVPEWSGLDTYYSALAEHVDDTIPVYGLLCVGRGQPYPRTMEALATHLISEIRTVQPSGPYRIAGWSWGGTLAYEIATQLIGDDQAVEFLGLFDTGACNYDTTAQEPGRRRTANGRLLDHVLGTPGLDDRQSRGLSELRDIVDEIPFVDLVARIKDVGVNDKSLFRDFYDMQEMERFLERSAAHADAAESYVEQPISIPVHLFIARDETSRAVPSQRVENALGWADVLPPRLIQTSLVPGDHHSMMAEHVSELGSALSSALRDAHRSERRVPEEYYDPLVTISLGSPRAPIVYCVPGAGDSATQFIGLANALGDAFSVQGFQYRGLDYVSVPHSTVEAAATRYVRAIDEAGREGPVHLIGHSFGGWIAFEMARRLRAGGRRIASLTIIDSEAPTGAGDLGKDWTAIEAMCHWIAAIELAIEEKSDIDLDTLQRQTPLGRLSLVHKWLVRVNLISARSRPESLQGPFRTFCSGLRARYAPAEVNHSRSHMVLLPDTRLSESENGREHDRALTEWRRWIPDLVEWFGPGNHMTILRPPYVQELASWWRRTVFNG